MIREITDDEQNAMGNDFTNVITKWAEQLGADGYGVPEADIKRALEAAWRTALDESDLLFEDEGDPTEEDA